jgi:DNA replication protein DnaC
MALANCPKCGGTGWKIVEGDVELPPTIARHPAPGTQTAARVAVACECVEAERAGRSLDRARIPSRYEHCDFESFDTDLDYGDTQSKLWNQNLSQAKMIVEAFARDYPLANEAGLLLMGPCGTGKTHLAVSALKQLIARGHDALFYDYRDLLKEIQASYGPDQSASEMSVLDPVLRTEILLLDDLGASKPSAWALETIGHILTARYNEKRVTLLTTNYLDGPDEPEATARRREIKFPGGQGIAPAHEESLSQRIGTRIRSRLYEMCRTVEINAPDYRRKIRNATGVGS